MYINTGINAMHLGVSYSKVPTKSFEQRIKERREELRQEWMEEMVANRDILKNMDSKLIATLATKLYALQSLAWDYIDTVLDLCIQEQIEETKKHARKIRKYKRDYDQFHMQMGKDYRDNEAEQGLRFEEIFREDFKRMNNMIDHELGRHHYKGEQRMLMRAVFQAAILICTVLKYGLQVDDELRKHGAKGLMKHCLIHDAFLRSADEYATLAERLGAPSMKSGSLTTPTNIFVNRIKGMEVNIVKDNI